MFGELSELYQQVILDHSGKPRNFGELDGAERRAEGYNPLCGDRINVELKLGGGDVLQEVAFTGQGCAICTASASMMTESLKGKSREEARQLFERFQGLVTGKTARPDAEESLGKLSVFAGVREFPVRIKCATLPWHTFQAAMEDRGAPVSTE